MVVVMYQVVMVHSEPLILVAVEAVEDLKTGANVLVTVGQEL